jgi:hypothetical protein
MNAFFRLYLYFLSVFMLAACGSGDSGSMATSSSLPVLSSSSSSVGSSSATSKSVTPAIISGTVTYDFVPHKTNHLGLDYNNTQRRPVRGAVIELLDASSEILSSQITSDSGTYQFNSMLDDVVQVRVKAQLLDQASRWNVDVRDNTQGNSLYAAQGTLTGVSSVNEFRNIHLESGWSGTAYVGSRSAAPFAILDSVYTGIKKIQSAGISKSLPEVSFFWSENNTSAEGDVSKGEIGTSYFSTEGIYILGDDNVDIDEYDSHVILHEWTHYLENSISRSDSIGGDHDSNQKLDMRLAFSEGLANAFSAIFQDDAFYADALGQGQASGFLINMAEKSHSLRGWYSQASVGSILFNYYLSNDNRVSKSIDDIFKTFTRQDYVSHPTFSTIFLFSEKLQMENPASFNAWSGLLTEQNISSADAYAQGETNAGGYSENLPVYKIVSISNPTTTLCSSNRFGSFNHLSNYQFVRIDISQPGNYRIQVVNSPESSNTDPDVYLYQSGSLIKRGVSSQVNQEIIQQFLMNSTYVLTLTEAKVLNAAISSNITHCFNLTLSME